MSRSRRVLLLALAALAGGAAFRGGIAVVEAALEGKLRARLVAEAAERGLALSVDRVRVGFPFRASLSGISVSGRGVRARLERLDVRAGLRGRGVLGHLRRLDVGGLAADLPQGLSVSAVPSSWDISLAGGILALAGRDGEGTVELERPEPGAFRLRLGQLDLTRLLKLRRDGVWVGDLGVGSGIAGAAPASGGGLAVETNLLALRARLAAPPEEDATTAASLGEPFDAEGSVSATLYGDANLLEVACASGSAAGLRASLRTVAVWAPRDLWFDAEVSVPRLELAPLLAASGLDLPATEGDLGSAALEARVTGRMLDPKSFVVEERLDFQPPARPLPGLERFRSPFRRLMTGRDGRETLVTVDPASPDFVSLDDVPPLFLRALLISEDANFWGHSGLDLSEVPVAMSINWVRGQRARGASTITQQLAKNLFLNRERSYRRKLQEAALALLLEPSLGKRRILEIYLNVIEWGPGLHGLGPAARHYFGKNPSDLTPRESAFLVSLIPGPVKYQPSFANGVLSRGFARLVNACLRRLRSVDALTDEELAAELAAPLVLRWTPPDAVIEPLEEPGTTEEDALAEGPLAGAVEEPAGPPAGQPAADPGPPVPGGASGARAGAPSVTPPAVPEAAPAFGPSTVPTISPPGPDGRAGGAADAAKPPT
jgi:hypothetical protein